MQRLAIIGTGIAGLGAGYFLRDEYDITFFEKNDYAGGHTHTLTIDEEGTPVYIDSAFMVYNEITYPNLVKLFNELNVKTKPTDMSFSVQHVPSGLEYCGTGISGLFAQRRNLLSPRFIRMLLDMDRFNKQAPNILDEEKYLNYSLMDYVKEMNFGEDFYHKFIVPMSSAVWSMPPDLMNSFPVVTLVRFFKNHGFLGLSTHYQWRTVVEGSQRYREKILNLFKGRIHVNHPIVKVQEDKNGVTIYNSNGERQVFDKVILASHADESLGILAQPTQLQKDLLSKFRYQPNKATLHTDETVMPRTKRAWSSWNYRLIKRPDDQIIPSTIYYMNNLQQVSKKRNYFISINEADEVDRSKILWERDYHHPIFDVPAMRAQNRLADLNKEGAIYFCGSYFKYGFHEDALTSGLEVARLLSPKGIWE